MKGHMQDGKFHPHSSSSGLTSKQILGGKTKFAKRLTQKQVNKIKANVLPLDSFAKQKYEFYQGLARRDRIASPKWNEMTYNQRLQALETAGVYDKENMFAQSGGERKKMANLPYNKLPHHAKTDLGFHYFKLNREGNPQ